MAPRPQMRARQSTPTTRRRGITALLVTHDLKESMRMGDSFAMMRGGRVHAYADRKAFCADPASGVEREAAFWQAFTSGDAQVSGCDARTADS